MPTLHNHKNNNNITTMKKSGIRTKESLEDSMAIEEMYQNRVKLIYDLRTLCHLSLLQTAAIVGIDPSSLSRYETNNRTLTMLYFIQICYYFNKYIEEKHIKITPEIKEEIQKLGLFPICNY